MKIDEYLRQHGFRAIHLRIITDGAYSARDSEWNYSDVPHTEFVHRNLSGYQILVEDDYLVAVNLQRIGPFIIPILTYMKHSRSLKHDYFLSILNIFIQVSTTHQETGSGCRTITNYSFFFRGLIGKVIALYAKFSTRKNNAVLMTEDLPMRIQKGNLRKQGIIFTHDQNTKIGFRETLDIGRDNVDISPIGPLSFSIEVLDSMEQMYTDIPNMFLRIMWDNQRILILPKICPHEGAELLEPAKSPSADRCILICPWHGRKILPLHEFPRGINHKTASLYCNSNLLVSYVCNEHNLSEFLTITLE